MNRTVLTLSAVVSAAVTSAFGADHYTVYKICDDTKVIHTSDGADAGHVEYIIADPTEDRIVSAVVTGGVVANRLIPVPYADFEYGNGENVVVNIDRERLVSAPVIEHTHLVSGAYIEPSVIEHATTYWGGWHARSGVNAVNVNRTGVDVNRTGVDVNRTGVDVNGATLNERGGAGATVADPNMRNRNGTTDATGIQPGSRNAPNAASTDASRLNERASNATESNRPNATTNPNEPNASATERNRTATPNATTGSSASRNENGRSSANEPNAESTKARNAGEAGLNRTEEKAGNAATRAEEKAGSATSRAEEKAGSAASRAEEKAGSAATRAEEGAAHSRASSGETSTEGSHHASGAASEKSAGGHESSTAHEKSGASERSSEKKSE